MKEHWIPFSLQKNQDPEIKNMICSVLAGYVWDTSNPYVKDHDTALHKLAKLIKIRDKMNASSAQL